MDDGLTVAARAARAHESASAAPPHLSPEEIEAAAARGDWRSARALFDHYRRSPAREAGRLVEVAVLLMDWLAVLDAEDGRISRAIDDPSCPLPRASARAGLRARLALGLLDEAVALARACRARFPDQPAWRRAEAKALLRSEFPHAALAIGREAWEAGDPAAPVLITKALIALERPDACAAFLADAEARAGEAPSAALLRARADFWTAVEKPAFAIAALNALKGHMADADLLPLIARQAAVARDLTTLDRLLRRATASSERPRAKPEQLVAAAAILEAHFMCVLDREAIEPALERLSRLDLSPKGARALCRLLSRAGDYPAVEVLASRAQGLFPASVSLRTLRLQVLTLLGDQTGLAEAHLDFRRDFPPDSYRGAMSRVNPRAWDLDDLPGMLAYNLNLGDGRRQAKFLMALAEAPLGEEQIDDLREGFANSSPLRRAQVEMMLAPLADRRLLEISTIEPVGFTAFRETEARTRERMVRITRELAPPEEAADPTLMRQCLRLIAGLREGERRTILDTRESYAQASSLAALLIEALEHRQPASVLRLGDGEGHFLPAPEGVEPHRAADRAMIQNTWWGAKRMTGERLARIEARFREAVDDSTLLGIIPPWRFIAQMASSKNQYIHRGILAGVAHGASIGRLAMVVTSMHFPNDLHKWNLWSEIFASVPSISYVSCHDMRVFFRESFGVETRQAIHIPGEHKYAGLFNGDALEFGDDTLLDRHEAICEALEPQPGELYIVAAGFLGKIYCDLIRLRGGVGVDVGSLADYWMGFSTRRYRLEQSSDVGLPNAMIRGHPLATPRDVGRIVGSPLLVRSSRDCRYNIAEGAEEEAAAARAAGRTLLRVVGHPRCASAYTASLFTRLGLRIGHEKLLRDGICSWMHAVEDLHVPYGDNASRGVIFERTAVHVRDPAEAVPSIMLENARSQSFNFRRLHILRETGFDLCDHEEPVERAVASLIHWYEIIRCRFKPDAVFRVEEAETAAPAWLAETDLLDRARRAGSSTTDFIGVPASASDGEATPFASGEDDDDGAEVANINNSAGKFSRAKPVVPPESYASLPAALRDGLARYCERFGYARPW